VDNATGFSGAVVSLIEYLGGQKEARVSPTFTTKEKTPDSRWIHVGRLKLDT